MRLSLATPTTGELARLLAEQADQDLTYPHVGATAGQLPDGYRVVRDAVVLGEGPAAFNRLAERLWAWDLHRAAGFQVYPAGRANSVGTDVVLAARLLIPYVLLACRVVRVIDEADRAGFAYGTLPMHPESGEESFVVERTGSRVRFVVTAFSRPTSRIRRLGAPVQDRIQDRFTTRYIDAAEALASGDPPSV